MRRLYIALAVLAALAACFFALSFSAIRSDFFQHGCHDIPKIEWEFTANCLDGNFGMNLTAALALLAAIAFGWSVWRLRRG